MKPGYYGLWGGAFVPEVLHETFRELTAAFARAAVNLPKPVLLAGGLNPGNVGALVERFRPFGVDVASGVESAPGVKDHALVREFISNAKAGSSDDGSTGG